MSDLGTKDMFWQQVCPITDEGCDGWTIACDDPQNPVDYSITDILRNPMNDQAAREIGRLCWGGGDSCGVEVMVQVMTGSYERSEA